MSNPKTVPCPPKPVPQSGWVHKCDLDDYLDRHLPIPTQVVSNEEYYPLPPTREQKAVEHDVLEMATRNAKRLGIDRREYLRSACGMAAAFTAMNNVFGECFRVEAAEMVEAASAAERAVESPFFSVLCLLTLAASGQPLSGLLLGANGPKGSPRVRPHVAPLTRTRLSSRLLDRWL
jgi:hypothetical protein